MNNSVSMETPRSQRAVMQQSAELHLAHQRLDALGVPRIIRNQMADLAQRISYMAGKVYSRKLFEMEVEKAQVKHG